MRIPRYIIDNLPARVRIPFLHWTEYMEKNLSFNLADSEIHTKGHSERVLLYALLIGEKMAENTKTDLCVLAHAAIFHDTRRLDDGLDTGHGARAASYYMKYCEINKDITFMNVASLIMKYHDRDDETGFKAIALSSLDEVGQAIRLYRIFKDADALDRFRLAPDGLDVRFLRNQEAVQLVDFARDLVRQTIQKMTDDDLS